jgi:hypothetical protein
VYGGGGGRCVKHGGKVGYRGFEGATYLAAAVAGRVAVAMVPPSAAAVACGCTPVPRFSRLRAGGGGEDL